MSQPGESGGPLDPSEPLEPYVPLVGGDDDLPPLADTPMWLSHHWPWEYERCVVIGSRHVCRRCIWMYPAALVAGILAALGYLWPARLDPWFIWLLPLPAVIEFVADNAGWVRYSGRRQVVLSVIGAVAAGRGYVIYLDHHTDHLVWGVVAAYCVVCGAAALVAGRRKRLTPP